MDYKKKYLKYKDKYLKLKNQTGGNYNHIIALLWINKNKGPIQQISRNQDLHIKDKIIQTYNMFKHKYNNPKVILFINRDKYTEEDFNDLASAGVEMCDIEGMEVVQRNIKLQELLYPEKYKRGICPIYQLVDMLKILIQYEYMNNPEYNYDYVVFSDLDIQDKDSLKSNDMECKPDRPDFIDEYYPNKIFDKTTIRLLNTFGYVMNGRTDVMTDYDGNLSESEINELNKNNNIYPKKNIVKLNNKILNYTFEPPENMFLICTKKPTVLTAIREYFIDYLFCKCLYELYNKVDSRNFIYEKYGGFYKYLNFLNNMVSYYFYVEESNYNKLKFQQNNLIENIDYKLLGKVNNEYKIDIFSPKCFKYIRDIFLQGDFEEWTKVHTSFNRKFFNTRITQYGKIVYNMFAFNINYAHNQFLVPFKCIPIEHSSNSSGVL